MLTCFILIIPLGVWLFYQFIYPHPQEQYFLADDRSSEDSNDSASALANFPAVHIQTMSDDEPFYERFSWIESEFTLAGFNSVETQIPVSAKLQGHDDMAWNMLPDKRSLRLRFEEALSFFGERAEAYDWILLAGAGDRSLLRNYSALHLARRLSGLGWTPLARPIHLYVNDEYIGIYLLTEEKSSAHQHLNLIANQEPALSEFFFEMQWRANQFEQEEISYIRVNSHPYGIIGDSSADAGFERDSLYIIAYPEEELLTSEHFDYLQRFLTETGMLLRQENFAAFSRRVDLGSLIDFYLVQELYKNVDAGFSNTFLQIRGQGANRRLYHGPVWDFDIAAGNAYWIESANQTPFGGLYVAQRHYWYWYLIHIPEFFDLVIYRWNSVVRNEALLMIAYIDRLASIYQEEYERNFKRHDILGLSMWPSPEHLSEIQTFEGQVTFLIEFLTDRVQYLDDIFNGVIPMWRWR